MAALVDHHMRAAGLEHRGRFVPSGDETGDDMLDVVEVQGGVRVGIQL